MEKTIHASVKGMTCAACAQTVEKAIAGVGGVKEANINLVNHSAKITFDDSVTSIETLQTAVAATGYGLGPANDPQTTTFETPETAADRDRQNRIIRNNMILAGLFSVPVMMVSMRFMHEAWAAYVSMVLSAPVVFWFGRDFFRRGFAQLTRLNSNMDTLVALSTASAWFFSAVNTLFPDLLGKTGSATGIYFESAAMIIFFVMLGKWLEAKAGKRTRLSLMSLMELQPRLAIINRFGTEEEIPVDQVHPGDELIVKPGAAIPVDGIVLSGHSWVEESFLTGESTPVEKTQKSRVWAGTINQDGHFHMVAHKTGHDTYLAELIRAVVDAQGSKAPVQKMADRISGVFVPTVIAIALLTFIGWLLSGSENALELAFSTSISVLIIACPCALGLATPTAVTVALGVGARNGILIKNAEALQQTASISAVVVDKTGTITEGKPTVSYIRWLVDEFQEIHADELYSLELKSEHPMAKAICAHFSDRNFPKYQVTDFTVIRGRGMQARINDKLYYVGSSAFMQELGIRRPVTQFRSASETVSYFAMEGQLLAEIHIEDNVREGAREAVQNLIQQNVRIHLATGDQNSAAETVAQEVGIKAIRAQMLPHQKREYVQDIQAHGFVTAMVGDGINDAEAMAVADVSVAMARGSDLAVRVADITLSYNDLRGVPKVIGLAKRTMKVIKQNLFWAFLYNIAAIPLAAGALYPVSGILLSPMIAGAAMAFSSVTVVLNSLKLNKHNFETNSFSITRKAGQ